MIGQTLDEKYRIEKLLGQGGMGAVYLATHLGTERPVALKLITPQFMQREEFVERFRREARAAGRLRHPNVVDVTDFGFARLGAGRVAYLVMEYLDGCSLGDVLEEESSLPLDWAIDIFEQACSAVDVAHQQGIIHRDLKPDNIWLEPNHRGGYTVKVLDFGLAKLAEPGAEDADTAPADAMHENSLRSFAAAESGPPPQPGAGSQESLHEAATWAQPAASEEETTRILVDQTDQTESVTQLQLGDEGQTEPIDRRTRSGRSEPETAPSDRLTRAGSIMGTPLYMSPEQCSGHPLDPRSDIYSLGVIAYKMFSGQTPFSGDLLKVIDLHIGAPPPPLREKNPKIPKKVSRVVMSALDKDPARRPATAAGFASALRAQSEGTGALFRRALALYSEHFPAFFRLSLLVYLPLIVFHTIMLVNSVLSSHMIISARASRVVEVILLILTFFMAFLANSIIIGVTVRLVTQLYLVPLRPVQLRAGLAAVRKRLKPLLMTLALVAVLFVLGMILFVIPGIVMFINYSLVVPVVMMENLRGRAALKRSKALVKRARRTVIATRFIEWIIPALASSLTVTLFGTLLKMMNVPQAAALSGRITGLVSTILNVFIIPFSATLSALLYLKTRQVGGETPGEVLSELEGDEAPRSKWQMRMRERLSIHSNPSR